MYQVIDEINKIKRKFASHDLKDELVLTKLCNELRNNNKISNLPIIQFLIKDLDTFINNQSLELTKNFINKQQDNIVISLFNAPYFKTLSVDGFYYEILPVNANLSKHFGDYLLPVNIIKSTEGFSAREVVALFPENHIDATQFRHDKIFYFIDKFVDRFYKITQKILCVIGSPHFEWLKTAKKQEIEEAAIYWVYLHEHFHHTGYLPVPEYLHIKKIKALAGLEELRVDICSILYLSRNSFLEPSKSKKIAEFILAERLLRYSVEGIPFPNYDAIASQFLFQFLKDCGGLSIKNDLIYIDGNIFEALDDFVQLINKVESNILEYPEKEVQAMLLSMIQKYTAYDSHEKKYHHNEYFKMIKNKYFV